MGHAAREHGACPSDTATSALTGRSARCPGDGARGPGAAGAQTRRWSRRSGGHGVAARPLGPLCGGGACAARRPRGAPGAAAGSRPQRGAAQGPLRLPLPRGGGAGAGGLRGHAAEPALFPAEAAASPPLLGRLRRAERLRHLERLLLAAAQRAADLSLCDESEAVKGAMQIARSAEAAPLDRQGRRRLDRLRPALAALRRRFSGARPRRRPLSAGPAR